MRKFIAMSLLAVAAAPVFAHEAGPHPTHPAHPAHYPGHAHVASQLGPSINEQQERQEWRIQQGLRSGRITRHELEELRFHQARIQRLENMARADRHVDPYERARLNRALDRQANRIDREMSDGEVAHRRHGGWREARWEGHGR